MSSFNPNNHAMTAVEWLETARDSNEQTGAQFTIVSGIVLSLFAAAAASPVTGVLVAAYFLNKAWKDTQAANRNDRAIDHYGCVAPFLKESDLQDYARQVGPQNAATEIRWALENGFVVKSAALDFLEAQGVNVDRLLAPAAAEPTEKPQDVDSAVLPSAEASESAKVEEKFPKPDSAVLPSVEAPEAEKPQNVDSCVLPGASRTAAQSTEIQLDRYDIRKLTRSGYVESILWVGFSQSGKTTTADQLGRALREHYGTNLRAFYVTPVFRDQGENDERSLFDWCDKALRLPLLNETDDLTVTSAYEDFESLLDEFLALPSDRRNPKLFIADELTIHALYAVGTKVDGVKVSKPNAAAQSFFGKLVNAINANASGGKAQGIGLWGLSPSGAVGGIGLNQNAMSSCVPVFVGAVNYWNGGVHAAAARNNLAPQDSPTPELIASCRRHGFKRLISVGCGAWQPLMEHEVPRPSSSPEPSSNLPEPLNPFQGNRFSDFSFGSEPKKIEAERSGSTGSEPGSSSSEPGSDSLNLAQAKGFSGSTPSEPGSVPRFTARGYTAEQMLPLISFLKDLNQTQTTIIESLWGVKKGGSKAWESARAEYQQLTGE